MNMTEGRRDALYNVSASAPAGRPAGPSRASTRLGHVVDVQDTRRILECSQTERQRRVQHLVRHYLSQILHGCKSAYCHVPTCLSSSKRDASKPHRPPTLLTATALAHYLAGQDNPNRGLCPHELNVAPESFEIANNLAEQARNDSAGHYAVYPSVGQQATRSSSGHGTATEEQEPDGGLMSALGQRQQARKDPKALGQNLYDTLTMIYSYTTHIPSPASVLASLVAPASQTEGHHAEATAQANAHSTTTQLNGKPGTVRQLSHRATATHGNSHSTNTVAEVLTNGQHVHKIPYHPLNDGLQRRPSSTSHSTAVDGASDSTMLSMKKTPRKSFAIGGASSPAVHQTKPAPVTSRPATQHTASGTRPPPGVSIVPQLSCETLDKLKEHVHRHGTCRSTDFNCVVDFDRRRRTRRTKPLANRSLFYTLSDPEKLLASFHDASPDFKDSPLPHLDSSRLVNSFRDWNHRNGALIFDSLWLALEALFTPPPELDPQKSPRLRPSRKGASADSQRDQPLNIQDGKTVASRYLDSREAAHIVMICIHALTSLVPIGWPHTWAQIRKLRSWGLMVPNVAPNTDEFAHPYMEIIDELEYEPAIRLADRLLRAVGTRTCFEHILASLKGDADTTETTETLMDVVVTHLEVVERTSMATRLRLSPNHDLDGDPGWTVTATFMEWLRTVIVKNWDSKAVINRWSSVGTAVMILDKLHSRQQALYLHSTMFEMPIIDERIDTVNEPINYLTWEHHPNTVHVFEYPCLFSAHHLVAYFRTINFTEMMKQYDYTMRNHQMQRSLEMFIREPYWYEIKRRSKVTLSDYLVLDVSREEPLKDTLDQLWGQDKRMLLKPLKVKMGHKEGEVGLDHGGVTYEFFRVVLSEAFRPENGMFTIDPQTRMTWFQPQSLEPNWKFEMLGILFSLAIYNGITLPITFPLAFYDCLQSGGNPRCKHVADYDALDYIKDGWPSLADSFQGLLSWHDGDVSDIFMREYVFSYEVFGQVVNQNLSHESAPITTSSESVLVTNANREQYVRDYVRALTYDSIAPQLTSFIRGFLTCINARSLHLFTPSTLRHLIEGTHHISLPDLERCAKYEDGYSASHTTIRAFWKVVARYSQDDLRHLLEFVTASDRVPVTGYESITFHVVRINGAPGALPSSSTCFGKLYLPDYGNGDVLGSKLGLAIRNSKGFGNV
ncbi:hypothetical protein G6011_03920 [Alternaria panax]|uniref:HECT-type E3 ubiquitin transferase n=1 Tax=Alternaria panax TaxID=48097 RepID=A0AAD4NUH0_9PLEO|nr:hypothetical protein G6011_03920 [Alternaria panax]